MYAASDREDYARKLVTPIAEEVAKQRSKIMLPSVESLTAEYERVCSALVTQ
jgi:hypothetical protein